MKLVESIKEVIVGNESPFFNYTDGFSIFPFFIRNGTFGRTYDSRANLANVFVRIPEEFVRKNTKRFTRMFMNGAGFENKKQQMKELPSIDMIVKREPIVSFPSDNELYSKLRKLYCGGSVENYSENVKSKNNDAA
ncbi:MAG: hypothetical protein WC755_06430, partial [Candidatus Woesearchaeota archaeon]